MARVYVSMGSNIERNVNVRAGLDALRQHFGELLCSAVYESKAVGFAGDNFYNLVVGFDTGEDVYAVARILHEIEDKQKRRRDGGKFASRSLDLDLILYDDLVLAHDRLKIPRDEIETYAFVLQPLAEIAPHARHPVSGIRYAQLWAQFEGAGKDEQWVVPFDGSATLCSQ